MINVSDLEKLKLKYKNKKISILGDSISTLQGFNPEDYKVYYEGERSRDNEVFLPCDTWWGTVIKALDAKLLVNNSWSGSLVSAPIEQQNIFPSAVSDERTNNLSSSDILPDVIIIYMGINDYIFGAYIDGVLRDLEKYNCRYFSYAYDSMLKKLKKNYPDCEIMCATVNSTYVKGNDTFVFPKEMQNSTIAQINDVIISSAENNACELLDLFKYNLPYETLDTVHPTRAGMKTLAELMINEINEIKEQYK